VTASHTRLLLLVVTALLIFWDVAVLYWGRGRASVSEVVLDLCLEHPAVAFLGGLLMGHLFLSQQRQ